MYVLDREATSIPQLDGAHENLMKSIHVCSCYRDCICRYSDFSELVYVWQTCFRKFSIMFLIK